MSAPERIWANGLGCYGTEDRDGVPYLRADIAASQLAEAQATTETQAKLYRQALARAKRAEAERDRLAADNARLRDMAFRAADQCDLWIKQTYSGGWSTHQVESQRELAKSLRLSAGKE